MEERLWSFTDNQGSFESLSAHRVRNLYFPLGNSALMSAITPDLHGDIKTGQNTFLLTPVSRIDLVDSRSSRNFWIYRDPLLVWSACGVSKDIRQIESDTVILRVGILWQEVTRENAGAGIKAQILSFVPASGEPVEIMQVTITNVSVRPFDFIPTAAIPIYARSAHNIRDHRHVTSLLQRITPHKYGVIVTPALVFDEAGHTPNSASYFVVGCDADGNAPEYRYPTREMFCGEGGDLEAPESILKNILPRECQIQGRSFDSPALAQGKEAMGALRFAQTSLGPGESRAYIILMGITDDREEIDRCIKKFGGGAQAAAALEETKNFWRKESSLVGLSSGGSDFDNWFRWVSIQPLLRRIFGCSFLPDFDYGKGGRGWRDLWQDCLGLILSDPVQARGLLINNFSGVKIDGSNATIIGGKCGEFIADRNNIARTWMDHGIWPLLTLDLYMQETGDFGILFEEAPYFHDHHIFRSRASNPQWTPAYGNRLRISSGRIYKGTIFEHLFIQTVTQFFNVGAHNHVRLEGADWNDGLDMAADKGESVAFSAMYAHNLNLLADILEKTGRRNVRLAGEFKLLLKKIAYNDVRAKRKLLDGYFAKVTDTVSGGKIAFDAGLLIRDLREKAAWMAAHIRAKEWLKEGFFNGYYDNRGARVEGDNPRGMRMMLASQVFAIMSGVAGKQQVEKAFESAQRYLADKQLTGFHLNTDFGEEQHHLGRAFSFIYGDKENGAYFNHMSVMCAFALYTRGYADEGWRVLRSIADMALDTATSRIYPCLPEYFDLEGRGMYSYLTGSASWFVLTMLTQVFGVKGSNGDLLIEPKLTAGQFRDTDTIGIGRVFAGRKLTINFSNPQRLPWGAYTIVKARLNDQELSVRRGPALVILRSTILSLSANAANELHITLG